MRKFVGSLALAGVMLVGSPAGAEEASQKDPNKVVCKKIYPTGSRTRVTKVCATEAQWAEEAGRGSNSVKTMQGKAGVGGGGAQNPFGPSQ